MSPSPKNKRKTSATYKIKSKKAPKLSQIAVDSLKLTANEKGERFVQHIPVLYILAVCKFFVLSAPHVELKSKLYLKQLNRLYAKYIYIYTHNKKNLLFYNSCTYI